MPLNNSDFGNKFVYLGLNNFDDVEWIDLDSNAIKIFFPLEGKNHPGSGSGITPNWYYYWSDALGISGIHRFEELDFEAHATVYSCDNWDIVIGRQAVWSDKEGNPPTGNRYIDGFVATTEHELLHRDHIKHNFCVHGHSGIIPNDPLPIEIDHDRDGICDNDPGEPPYNGDESTCGGWEKIFGLSCKNEDDIEVPANNAEISPRYLHYGNQGIDWAYPGSQWE
jgi:hypothetical protein